MSLTYKDVTEILRIIDASDVEELVLEVGDSKIVVRRRGAAGEAAAVQTPGADASRADAPPVETPPPQPAAEPTLEPMAEPAPAPVQHAEGAEVRAPMVGTFYRRPAPQDPPFVEVGDTVAANDPICVIEVMKLFTTIEAPVAGRIVEIAAENEDLVALDQLLFVIEPT